MTIGQDMAGEVEGTCEDKPAHRKLSLRRNFTWVFAGNAIYSFVGWVLLVVLAKAGSPAVVGVYALAQAICAPVSYLTGLQLRAVLVTDAKHEYSYGQYIALRVLMAGLTVLIVLAVLLLSHYPWETKLVTLLIAAGVAILLVREIFHAIIQRHECMNLTALSQIILALATLPVFAGLYLLTGQLVPAIAGMLGVRLAVMVLYDIPRSRSVAKAFAPPEIGGSFKPVWSARLLRLSFVSLPLGLAITVGSFNNNLPRYFLQWFHGDEALGYFAGMGAIAQVAFLMVNTLGMAARPRLAQYFLENRSAFERLTWRLQLIGAGVGVIGVGASLLVGEPVLRLLLRPDYAEYAREFVWMMASIGLMFMVGFLVCAISATRSFWLVLYAWSAAALSSVVLSLVLIPRYGILGACWVRVGSSLVALLCLAAFLLVKLRRAGAAAPGRQGRPGGLEGAGGEL